MDITQKGLEGELALNSWLQDNGLSYLYVDQSLDTFATLFKGALKRPDFLVLLESIGMIAVDVKNKQLWEGRYYSLGFESEFQKALTFERIFRIPLWYAYKGERDQQEVWYWLSALKAIEVGEIKINSSSGEQFLAIPLDAFEEIASGMDLGKLYTHRLTSLQEISRHTNPVVDDVSEDKPFKIETIARVSWDQVYNHSYSYGTEETSNVMFWLQHDVEFRIHNRSGDDSFFSTKDNVLDEDVISVIDSMSREIMKNANMFSETITVLGREHEGGESFVFDHLMYAVASVFYDNKNGSTYEILIDESRLTIRGKEILDDLRNSDYSAQVGRHGDYMLFASFQ